ncbi:MAG TPA: MFS transporter, partial [Caulobacterales bacterium]|nr:MFS transporter [Caulobacterales bacterium]
WGYVGDRTGFRAVTLGALGLWIASTLLLLNYRIVPLEAFAMPVGIMLAFVGLGASGAGYQMASSTMVLEFGSREDMPMRLGVTGTAEGAMASAGPLIGGLIATGLGYPILFVVSMAFLAAAFALLYFRIEEPRNRRLAAQALRQDLPAGAAPLPDPLTTGENE